MAVLPPVLRTVLPERIVDLPVSAPLDAALAKAFPKVGARWFFFPFSLACQVQCGTRASLRASNSDVDFVKQLTRHAGRVFPSPALV